MIGSLLEDLMTRSVIPFDEFDPTEHSHEIVGADLGDVPFSVILVHSKPGAGPRLHRHPYPEVFIVESGEATFQLGDVTAVVRGGNVVVAPSGARHGFTNTGTDELRLTAIHGAARFDTEWLAGSDPTWTSRPRT